MFFATPPFTKKHIQYYTTILFSFNTYKQI